MLRFVRYTWAAPTTMVGLLAGALTVCTGGRAQVREGTLEFHGGFSRWLAEKWSFSAMTLGHVIIGRDPWCLDFCRDHEQAHVRRSNAGEPCSSPPICSPASWLGRAADIITWTIISSAMLDERAVKRHKTARGGMSRRY